MAIRVNRDDVGPEEHEHVTVWRFVRRDGPTGVGVGISAFRASGGLEPRAGWEAHDVAEVHYVLSGEGILLEEDEEVPLRPGDAVVTQPGVRHALWSTSDRPLVTLYVAAGGRAAT